MKKLLLNGVCAVLCLCVCLSACSKNKKDNTADSSLPDNEQNSNIQSEAQPAPKIPDSSPFAQKMFSRFLPLGQAKNLPKVLSFNEDSVIDEKQPHQWTVNSLSDTQITIDIGGIYTFDAALRGEQIIGCLADNATGESEYYYSSSLGFDRSWREYIYTLCVKYVDDCLSDAAEGMEPSFDSELDEEIITYTGSNAWKKLHDTFESLGDYRDSADYLARFFVLEDMYTGAEMFREREGEKRNYITETVTYYPDGKIFSQMGIDMYYRWFGGYGDETQYFVYDANGRLAAVQEREGDTITLQVALKYDANGGWINTKNQTEYLSRDVMYKSNEQGVLTENMAFYASNRYHHSYTYDENGRVVQIVTHYGTDDYEKNGLEGYPTGMRTIVTFEYDEQGFLIKESRVTESMHYPVDHPYRHSETMIYEYQNDPSGNHQSANVTWIYGSRTEPYWPIMHTEYHYEDLYFFR